MRRPAAVLVDRKFDSEAFRFFDERATGCGPRRTALRQDMLAGGKGAPHQACSHVGVGRHVDDLDPEVLERPFEVVRRVGVGKERVAACARRRITRTDQENVQPRNGSWPI